MDRYKDSEMKRDSRNHGTGRKQKKRWTAVVAVVAAITVAAGAIGISAAENSSEDAGTAYLTLADTGSITQTSAQTGTTGFVLTDVSDVVEEVLPSVVSITSRQLINYYDNYGSNGFNDNFSDIWEFFFGDSYGGRGNNRRYYQEVPSEEDEAEEQEEAQETPNEIESGMGSGTIIAENDSELLILTSYHVVEGSSSLYVTFINDESVDGYIKSADADRDIAIVAVPLEDIDQETLDSIAVATISTEAPRVGEGVIVIGNALGYGTSVTAGIVSAVNREITVDDRTMNVIQTDAAINFGNSGGCMLNAKGEIIGISEAKATVTYVEEMYYAIPVLDNLDLIETLLNSDEIFTESRTASENSAYLGIRGRDVTMDISSGYGMPLGVYVSSTVAGSGAEEAGVQSGDIIVGLDDKEIETMEELQYELSFHEAGDVVELVINRLQEGTYVEMTLEVTLTDRIS